MKTKYISLLGLILPMLSHGSFPEKLRELDSLRLKTALCQVKPSEIEELEKNLITVRRRGNKGEAAASEVLKDYQAALNDCNESALLSKEALLTEISNIDTTFPLSIMGPYIDSENEWVQDQSALEYIKKKDGASCPQISKRDAYNNLLWHEVLLTSGWGCSAENFKAVSQELNEELSFGDAQEQLEKLNQLSLQELKTRFKRVYKIGTKEERLKIAFVPQLSWENGTLNMTFPYKFFTKPTELTSYKFLTKELKKLGVKAVVLERNSLASLEDQVKETSQKLLKLDGPHLVISRSMGSRVVREMVADNNVKINEKITAWLNVGGTPHGSVIARYKIHPDTFYRSVIPSVAGAFKLPIGIIAKDPRVASHIEDTLLSAIVRKNLKSLESAEARHISESTVPVLNAVMLRSDYERSTEKVDPVWMHMLQYGPTEGSSLLTGAAVDTSRSMRVILDSDHLGFWKYSPKEALAIFLRLMILSNESGLNN